MNYDYIVICALLFSISNVATTIFILKIQSKGLKCIETATKYHLLESTTISEVNLLNNRINILNDRIDNLLRYTEGNKNG